MYRHPSQVWAMEPSPSQSDLVITSSQSALTSLNELTLYRLSNESQCHSERETNENDNENEANDHVDHDYSSGELLNLDEVSRFDFPDTSTFVNSVKWHSVNNHVLTLDPMNVTTWSIGDSNVKVCIAC